MRATPLTEREIEIARRRAADLRPKRIAIDLGVSVKTVSMSLYRIHRKLQVKTRAEFLRAAGELGLCGR